MDQLVNWSEVATNAVNLLVGAGLTSIWQMRRRIAKMRRDLNAAFDKIRDLEDEIYFNQ